MTVLDLPFSSPVTNASGMLGFNPAPREADLSHLGGFVTNPVSLAPRTASAGIRLVRFPGGVLLHSGLPNPGLRKVLSENRNKWARSALPVIVHLIAAHPDELFSMVRQLEETEGVAGLEVGLEAGIQGDLARAMVQAAVGELPVLVRPALEDVPRLAGEAADAGASALTIGPPRGSLPGPDGSTISGRIYGPAVRPLALEILKRVIEIGIPVIYSGGIRSHEEIDTTLALGAAGVQIDIALWNSGGLKLPEGSSSAPG